MANEKRLIDANALKYWEHTECYGHGDFETVRTVSDKEIAKMPTVDAVEVVHGRWEWYEALVNPYALCSNCGCGLDKRDALNFVYCPYCGAKMDGERKDNERKTD